MLRACSPLWGPATGLSRSLVRCTNNRAQASTAARPLRVLGIETSCDDTGVAVVERRVDGSRAVVAEALSSQFAVHAQYNGVVPILAARCHKENLPAVLTAVLSKVDMTTVDAIGVTAGPGLGLCLSEGVQAACKLATEHKKPLVQVNHLEAHALIPRLYSDVQFPFLLLLVSGGHTILAICKSATEFDELGSTADDSIGEAFDKVARMLHIHEHVPEYASGAVGHAGKALEMLAAQGDASRIRLPVPMARTKNCAFSFSGLKTAVVRTCKEVDVHKFETAAAVAASFQNVATKQLIDRTRRALQFCQLYCGGTNPAEKPIQALVVCGGVAANQYIRDKLTALAEEAEIPFVCPPPRVCTDNGVMVAWAGLERLEAGIAPMKHVSPVFSPRWAIGTLFPKQE